MARRIILHAGTAKTGTSFLQHLFATHRDHFAANDVCFPRAGSHDHFTDGGHHLLAIALMLDRWEELQLDIPVEEVNGAWDTLLAEIDAAPCRDALISSEWFAFDIYRPEDIAAIKQRLAGFEVRIVLTFRDVVDFVNSVYAQRVRDGYDGSAVDYIKLAWPHLNWRTVAWRWQAVFGRENVRCLDYAALRCGDFFQDFAAAALDRTLPLPEDMTGADRPRNRSISVAGTLALREVNASNLPSGRKERIRDGMKLLYEELDLPLGSGFLSDDLAELLRFTCRWP